MITWMQRRRKYLLITIWISAISLIGSYAVGWGRYDYNLDRAGAVVKVGDRKITLKEFQQAYSNYYNFYSSISNGDFNEEQAKQMGLQNIVLDDLINNALFLNYADSIGLITVDEEVVSNILRNNIFQIDGVFNKDKYIQTLKSSGISVSDYEDSLKKELLLKKIKNELNINSSDNEVEAFVASNFLQDRISIEIIKKENITPDVTEEEILSLWENTKNNYLTPTIYKVAIAKTSAQDQPYTEEELIAYYKDNQYDFKDLQGIVLSLEESRDEVIKALKLEKSKIKARDIEISIKNNELAIENVIEVTSDSDVEYLDILKTLEQNNVSKPFLHEGGYAVVQLLDVVYPKEKTFEQAKKDVKDILISNKQSQILEEKAKKAIDDFNGDDIGFVSKDTITIDGLNQTQTIQLLSRIFFDNNDKGYVLLDDKAVIYKITDQRLFNPEKKDEYTKAIKENVNKIKNEELNKDILNFLRSSYEIKDFTKGS